jgi:diguanylate cyclase (GGDEF)-like protein/PAS domain S-box-containing protein
MHDSSPQTPGNTGLIPLAARLAGFALIALGAAVILGWWLQSPTLVHVAIGLPPMSIVSATGLALAGAALAFSVRLEVRAVPAILGLVAALIGVAALAQYLAGADFGFDRVFDTGWLADERPAFGRIAPATAVGLLLGGTGVALGHLAPTRRIAFAVPLLSVATILIGLVALLAHVLGLELLLSWPPYAQMAVHTAFGLTLLGVGMWLHWHASPRFASLFRQHDDKRILFAATVAVVGVTIVGALTSFGVLQRQTEDTLHRWLAVSLQQRVEVYHDTLRNGVNAAATIATRPGLRRELARLRTAPDDPAARAFMETALNGFLDLGFTGVSMRDARGREIVRAGRFVAEPALRVTLSLGLGIELLWHDGPLLHIARTISDSGGTLGVLTTEQPLPLFGRLLDNIGGLAQSAEMTVCADQAGTIRCLPTRLQPGVFSLPYRVRGRTLPIAAALDGFTGVTVGPFAADGARVIAAYGPIPLTGLGMTIAVGTEELYRPMLQRLQSALWVLGALVLVAMAALWRLIQPMARALQRSDARARDALARLQLREAMLSAAMSGTSDAVYLKDRDGRYLMINAAGARRFGRTPAEVIGRDDAMLWAADVARPLIENDRQVMDSGETYSVEETVPMHGGARTYLVSKSPYRDETGAVIGLIGIARDITERRQAEGVLQALTLADELTGLRNRRGFTTLAEAEVALAQRGGRAAFLVYIDVQALGSINERFGRAAGDRALCEAADILRRTFRDSDIVARLEADDFAALVVSDDADAPEHLLLRLRHQLDELNRGARRQYELALGIGVARYDPMVHASIDALLHEAQAAMARVRDWRAVGAQS